MLAPHKSSGGIHTWNVCITFCTNLPKIRKQHVANDVPSWPLIAKIFLLLVILTRNLFPVGWPTGELCIHVHTLLKPYTVTQQTQSLSSMFSLSTSPSLSHTHTDICAHKQAHTLPAEGETGVSWISLYTSENWPNSPNYGITWANLIHHCNYLASAFSHTHTHTGTYKQTEAHTNAHLLWQQKVLI